MNNEIHGQWRAIAGEKLPYTQDFPEICLVLPEGPDNSLSQGQASESGTSIELLSDSKARLRIIDNGIGPDYRGIDRLRSMGSKSSTSINNRYGRGSRTMLAKLCPDYTTATWRANWRNRYAKGTSPLYTMEAPFVGPDQKIIADHEDTTTLPEGGFEWIIEFDRSRLGNIQTVQEIFDTIKELYRTRYSRAHFDKTTFTLEVKEGETRLFESSTEHKWTTFEECVQKEVESGNAEMVYGAVHPFNKGTMSYTLYRILLKGNTNFPLKKEFPRYGQKNQHWARVHLSLSGRMIEPRPIWQLYRGKEGPHNDFNGLIGFVNFESSPDEFDQLPTPSTTKVSFREDCTNHTLFLEKMYEINGGINPKQKPKQDPEPEPAPVDPPKKKPEISGVCDRRMVWAFHIDLEVLKHKCLCCRTLWITRDTFDVGHIISRADGGNDDIQNLRPICKTCNQGMKTKNMKEHILEKGYDKIL
jgi:hypothetical protein